LLAAFMMPVPSRSCAQDNCRKHHAAAAPLTGNDDSEHPRGGGGDVAAPFESPGVLRRPSWDGTVSSMVADSHSRTVTPPSVCLTQDLGIGVLSPPSGRASRHGMHGRCRGAEVAAATGADFASDTDAGYSYRVFLRHYCIHLAGPDPSTAQPAFPADARAARGFNGDLGQHLRRRRQRLESCERSGLVT